MAGSYSVTGAGLTLANQAVTLIFVNPIAAPNRDLSFRRFWVGQSNTASYTGNQIVQLNTQVTAFPTLVSATPNKLYNSDSASIITGATTGAAGKSGINASAEGAGAKTVIWPDAFSPANGWLLVLVPDEDIKMGSGSLNGLGVHFPVAATTLTNWSFGCTWLEK